MSTTHFQPLIEDAGWLSLRGGLLGGSVVHVQYRSMRWGERRLRFIRLAQRDTDLAKVLTGRPACDRPLSKLRVFCDLRAAIKAARERASISPAESAGEDTACFAEDLGVEEEPPKTRPRKTDAAHAVNFLEISVHAEPGTLDKMRSIVFENFGKALSMDVGESLENLNWLIAAVLRERTRADAVSVEVASAAASAADPS